MATTWVAAVEMLVLLAGTYPQAAYAGFIFCSQNEWQYVQHVMSDMAPHFAPLEVAIKTKFLPALLGIASLDLDSKFCKLLTHSVKTGSIAIRNLVDTAMHVYKVSLRATSHIVASMVDRDDCFDLEDHHDCVVCWGLYGRTESLLTQGAWTNEPSNIGISWPVLQGSGSWLSLTALMAIHSQRRSFVTASG
jgi:hypothetical protein